MGEMKEKKVWAAYFSGTGTTEKIVKIIAERLSSQLEASTGNQPTVFDFTLPGVRQAETAFQERDIVVFGVPVYAGRVPNVLLKYLNGINGGGAAAIPVVLYGNRNFDDALIELRNILETDGFHTVAAGAFIGEHSFSRILGKGRPDEKDLEIALDFAERIAEKLKKGALSAEPVYVKGEDPIRNYYQPRDRKGNPIDIRKVKPKTSDACIDCKLCARVCPMGSIDMENVREFNGICIKCCACVKKCPVGAKYYDDEGYLYHQHELEELYQRRAEPELFL